MSVIARSPLHRVLRGLLILISLGSTVAFVYFARHHGIVFIKGKSFPLPSDVAALASPAVGIAALCLAVLVETHERYRSFGAAFTQTFLRLWWVLAVVAVVVVWILVINHI